MPDNRIASRAPDPLSYEIWIAENTKCKAIVTTNNAPVIILFGTFGILLVEM